jgi:hypothetical protein
MAVARNVIILKRVENSQVGSSAQCNNIKNGRKWLVLAQAQDGAAHNVKNSKK